ncbi:type II toxin-antitoxin system RelE/ParE family toxin [Rhizobium sp. SGZ-381]|uniref:type II toxin-antitoxin system RelE/ParE family toxin n=1 Tax=Rhizobium sp. SGZ-381 TaxID=3342800 RepID=UPI00366C8361
MIIRWTLQATEDRLSIFNDIKDHHPPAALAMDLLFEQAAKHLAQFPRLGKAGLVAGTRELLPHPSYRLVYEIDGDTLFILTIVHTARAWPPVKDG